MRHTSIAKGKNTPLRIFHLPALQQEARCRAQSKKPLTNDSVLKAPTDPRLLFARPGSVFCYHPPVSVPHDPTLHCEHSRLEEQAGNRTGTLLPPEHSCFMMACSHSANSSAKMEQSEHK